jgi:hypothetical protein
MPERMRRLRGVEEAQVNPREETLEVHLKEPNRIRLEQIRDLIEQDGTRITRAVVQIRGDLFKADGGWMLRPAGVSSAYEITGPDLIAGSCIVTGEVRELHVTSGALRIYASQVNTR